MRFRERFDEALAARGLPPVHWGQGIWQQVLQVYGVRVQFVHVVPGISQEKLLTPLKEAERAITVLRNGIKAVTDLVGLPHPPWVNDDADPGWRGRGGTSVSADEYIIHAGAREDDPKSIRVTYILGGQEHLSEICPPGTPPGRLLDRLLSALNIPVDAVRVYRGSDLLEERPTKMRT
jgi:hypothetical protein